MKVFNMNKNFVLFCVLTTATALIGCKSRQQKALVYIQKTDALLQSVIDSSFDYTTAFEGNKKTNRQQCHFAYRQLIERNIDSLEQVGRFGPDSSVYLQAQNMLFFYKNRISLQFEPMLAYNDTPTKNEILVRDSIIRNFVSFENYLWENYTKTKTEFMLRYKLLAE